VAVVYLAHQAWYLLWRFWLWGSSERDAAKQLKSIL
jgi:hypothetical protein